MTEARTVLPIGNDDVAFLVGGLNEVGHLGASEGLGQQVAIHKDGALLGVDEAGVWVSALGRIVGPVHHLDVGRALFDVTCAPDQAWRGVALKLGPTYGGVLFLLEEEDDGHLAAESAEVAGPHDFVETDQLLL